MIIHLVGRWAMNNRIPKWIRVRIPSPGALNNAKLILRTHDLHTVCEGALCPNLGECFGKRTFAFMILGEVCTRNCPFCAVDKGNPLPPDPEESSRIAEVVAELGLRHVVITSVNRDDLENSGADFFASTVRNIRSRSNAIIEVLIPDFQGSSEALDIVIRSKPDILNHNLETIPRLHPYVKPKSIYTRSLWILKETKIAAPEIYTKSGLMVGFGEMKEEVVSVMRDLRDANCSIITIGQYLRPPNSRLEVKEYVAPEVFQYYEKLAKEMGFIHVASAPLVRSSYHASETGVKIIRQ
jgi:lipoic acid synthetase